MHNYFLRYEQDFNEWKNAGFPDVSPLTRDFLAHIRKPDPKRQLWDHQEKALLLTIYAYELLQFKRCLLNIVTGGGKTAIIGAVIAWLKMCHDVHKFLVLCPNTVVRDRLEDDLTRARVFNDFGFLPPGCEHYTNELGLHILEPGSSPQGILENGIVLGNIHQLYQSNISGRRNLAYVMNYVDEIAIFNDEAHNTPAPEYDNVLFALSKKCKFRLDTTATPDRADGQSPDSRMIYEYVIEDAQAEVPPIIKNVVVYQPEIKAVQLTYTNQDTGERRTVDEMDEEFEKIEKGLTATQWVTDPDPMRKQMQIAINRLEEQKRRADSLGKGRYKPILFVVAICIKDAEQAWEMLNEEFGLKTLLVTEKSDEVDRDKARTLGKNEYNAVVSVLMLREGWDVPEVGIILLLRKFSSRVYGQQVVGRGLRLNIRDEDIQEICAIIDHEKLKHDWLWDIVGAKVRGDVGQTDLFGDEDLPPKRKEQTLANPELLITLPEPEEDEETDDFFDDLSDIEVESGDFANWEDVIDSFEYDIEVEISKVDIGAVLAQRLFGDDFLDILPKPESTTVASVKTHEQSNEELGETIKNIYRDICAALLADEGIGSNELGYFYGIVMDHIRHKLLGDSSIGLADSESLNRAIRHRYTVLHHFRRNPGLVTSIVKYKREKTHASI